MDLCQKWQKMKYGQSLFVTMTVKRYAEKRAEERKRHSKDEGEKP